MRIASPRGSRDGVEEEMRPMLWRAALSGSINARLASRSTIPGDDRSRLSGREQEQGTTEAGARDIGLSPGSAGRVITETEGPRPSKRREAERLRDYGLASRRQASPVASSAGKKHSTRISWSVMS